MSEWRKCLLILGLYVSRVLCYHVLVLTGREVSAELLASKGVGTFNGEAGARPKLETKKLQLLHTEKNKIYSTNR